MQTGVRIAIGFAIMGLALGLASKRARFIVDLLLHGQRDPDRFKRVPGNLKAELTKVIGQKKLFQWSVPGILHALTFWGFLVIQITLIESVGELFDPEFKLPIIGHHEWLGFMQDLFMSLVVLALIGFAIIRMRTTPKKLERKSRFFGSHLWQAYFILLMIFMVVATVAVVRGARSALHTLPYPDWAFLSRGVGALLDGFGHDTLRWIEDVALLLHLAVVFVFLVIVLHSKHMHIFTSPLNVLFGRQPLALGALPPIEIDMENMTEDTVFGIGKVEDFTWKNLLDTITCTECGRCQSACPAWNTGKTLNPKFIITNTRDHLFDKADVLLGKSVFDMNDEDNPANKSLVGDVHLEESIWACTTCGACVYECPVDIEHLDHIVGMRRNLVMMESSFPPEAGLMLRNLENSGNPWGEAANKRLDWTKGLEDEVVVVNGRIPADAEYLYWVGCAGAFDDRAKKAVRAFAELMVKAGVSFAVLGAQENCSGDPARRMGNEYLFQEIAKANIETFKTKGVRKIVASCPHCFNTMANEYPQFGGTFEVIHHTELLSKLIAEGRIVPKKPIEQEVAYHDPCYMARHNNLVDEPRDIIASIPGVTKQEAGRCGKKTFCCGAGGARMWMEEHQGKRVNLERTEEMLAGNPDMVATACPYCMIMIDDGKNELVAKGEAREELKIVDVSQLLMQSMEPGPNAGTPRAPEAVSD